LEDNRRQKKVRETDGRSTSNRVTTRFGRFSVFQSRNQNSRPFGYPAVAGILLTFLVILAALHWTSLAAYAGDVKYVYDPLGRLTIVFDGSGNAATYQYDPVGNLLSIVTSSASQFNVLQPSSGSGQVGSNVTLYGTGFCATPTVTIDGVAATVVSASENEIVVTVPANASSGAIVVTCGASQIDAGAFTVTGGGGAPSITGFSPSIGAAGTSVTINGSNFGAAANDLVRFGGTLGQVASATTTAINAPVPSLAHTGVISVATSTGGAVSSSYFFVPPPPATASSISATAQLTIGGSPATVTTSPAGTQAVIGFDGRAGRQISLSVTNDSYPSYDSSTIQIEDPDGQVINSHEEFNGNFTMADVNLPSNGTYVIFVDPAANDAGTMTLQLFDTTNNFTGTMAVGGPAVTATTSVPGQDAVLTFAGTAGQQISLNATNDSYPPYTASTLQIQDPTGKVIASQTEFNGNFTLSDVNLASTGTYTIFIDPAGADTGSMTLQLFDTTNSFTGTINIGGSAVTATTSVPGQDAVLTFAGTAGQQISLNATNDSYPPYTASTLQIQDPTGKVIASQFEFNGNFTLSDVNLASTGTYTIFIDPAGAGTGSMTLQLFDTTDSFTGTINIGGSPVTATTSVPGQDAVLTFAGTAGQQISLNATNDSYPPYTASTLQIQDPTGKVIASQFEFNGNFSLADVNLASTGTYSVFVDPAGSDTGSMTLQLFDTTNNFTGTMSIGGPPVTANISTPGQDALLTFTATAGQQVSLNVTNDSFTCCGDAIQIKDPSGNVIASDAGFSGDFTLSDVNLASTGTYAVFVDPAGLQTGNITLQLWNLSDVSGSVNTSVMSRK
jgi:YD repeat-containing protein